MSISQYEEETGSSATSVPPRVADRPITVRSKRLQRALRAHGWIAFLVPAAGTALTIAAIPLLGVTWLDLGALVSMYLVCMVGVTVGLHRHLAHRAFKAGPFVRRSLVVAGSMAMQGPPTYWVATHRRHHRFADRPGDPHSPADGVTGGSTLRRLWHAHVGWTLDHDLTNTTVFARDLLADSIVRSVNRRYYWWVAFGFLAPAVLTGLVGWSVRAALGGLMWGGFVRAFLVYHATMSINSVTHWRGSAPHKTPDASRNVAWLAIPTCGESWHNNHHAAPARAVFGQRRLQVDLGGLTVRLLERLHAATDVRR